jgi:hypothetical protein
MLAVAVCAGALFACKFSGQSGGGPMAPNSVWDVYKAQKKVLIIKNAPGAILSTAMLPPGTAPRTSSFVTARALDALEENALGAILGSSRTFEEFAAGLKKKGYTLSPSEENL